MIYTFALLIAALIVKDTVPLGDQFILRGVSQGLALVFGLTWLFTQGPTGLYRKYALLPLYLLTLLFTILASREPMEVFFQVISLAAVVVFFVSFVESRPASQDLLGNGFR